MKKKYSFNGWNFFKWLSGRKKVIMSFLVGMATFFITDETIIALFVVPLADIAFSFVEYYIKSK